MCAEQSPTAMREAYMIGNKQTRGKAVAELRTKIVDTVAEATSRVDYSLAQVLSCQPLPTARSIISNDSLRMDGAVSAGAVTAIILLNSCCCYVSWSMASADNAVSKKCLVSGRLEFQSVSLLVGLRTWSCNCSCNWSCRACVCPTQANGRKLDNPEDMVLLAHVECSKI
jgi:hypothetical protein